MRALGKLLWRFMVIFSFIVNIILVIVLIVLGLTIFDIKHNIAQPLIQGLHSSFVGLSDSTIDWTIPVRTSIPLDTSIPLNTSIPLDTDTTVVLTEDIPLSASAIISLNGSNVSTPVSLNLPKGLELKVHLNLSVPVDLEVPVDLDVPVSLDVRAVIPLSQTQLNDPFENLRLLFEPIVRLLGNLPDDFGQVGTFASQMLSGNPPDLLAETPYSENPWPGYSITAGLNYKLGEEIVPPDNRPVVTGIVPVGGIPALDQAIRGDAYQAGTPIDANAQTAEALQAQPIPPETYNGNYGDAITSPLKQAMGEIPTGAVDPGQNTGTGTDGSGQPIQPTVVPGGDLGIISTPQPGG